MSEELTRAWRRGGEQLCAVSSRMVLTRFNLTPGESEGLYHQLPRGYRRRRSALFMTVVNVYAQTAKAPPSVQEKFVCDLQAALDRVPTSDILVVLGDFNARIGVRPAPVGDSPDLWTDVTGPFGLGRCIAAGEDLLMLCAANRLSIMNM